MPVAADLSNAVLRIETKDKLPFILHGPELATRIEDFYGGEVPTSTAARVIVRDLDDDLVHPFAD